MPRIYLKKAGKKIKEYLEKNITIKIKTECYFCGTDWLDEIETDPDYMVKDLKSNIDNTAKHIQDRGWREVESEEYQCIGLACKECAEKPDKER